MEVTRTKVDDLRVRQLRAQQMLRGDLEGEDLEREVQQVFPTSVARTQLDDCLQRDALVEVLVTDALAQYEAKEASIGAETLRTIERQAMLSMIDQHWREHLYEMDYLREGINLRAMGQKDPLSEWQREGFDMFEAMMGQIEDDFVRYVFHLHVVVDEQPQQQLKNVKYTAAEEPVTGSGGIRSAAFCLGVSQALDALTPDGEPRIFDAFDYFSTVSGGGYIGTSIVSGMMQEPYTFPFASKLDSQETPEIQHLRNYSNFLVPNGTID